MSRPLPPFYTSVVGSLPRPQYVKDLLAAGSRTGQHDAAWQRRMDDAVRFAEQHVRGVGIVGSGQRAGGNERRTVRVTTSRGDGVALLRDDAELGRCCFGRAR